MKLPTGYALHAEADFQFFDAVFGRFAELAIPDKRVFGRFIAIAGDDVVVRLIVGQISLAFVLNDNQPEGVVRIVHAVKRLGHGTIGIMLPRRVRYGGGHVSRGLIQAPAGGKRLAGGFAVIEDIGLVASRVQPYPRDAMPLG